MFLKKLFPNKGRTQSSTNPAPMIGVHRKSALEKVQQKTIVENLRIGMYVAELDIPWEQSNFMFQGFTINSVADIKALQSQCSYVYVLLDRHVSAKRSNNQNNGARATPTAHFDARSMEEEVDAAAHIHSLTSKAITDVFNSVRLGAELDSNALKSVVSDCVESVLRSSDASIWLTMLRKKSEATAQHSLNVTALSVILGKSMGYPPNQLREIGLCASLHDIGKTQLPDELVHKTGTLTRDEIETMQLHTTYGRDILMSSKSAMSGTADVAYCHHERPDGKGYPRGISGEQIPHYANIVAIAETYDSMTTKQLWRPAWAPSDALKVLYAERGKQFDEELVVQFIDAIGVFPPGSIIEMIGGEIGIVLSNTQDKLRPRVILLLDDERKPIKQKVVDLSKPSGAISGNYCQIRTTHENGSFGIDIEEFQRAGLRFN